MAAPNPASAHRIGLGTDRHRLEGGRPLWIGGVEIPASAGAVAHSDGDVVLHSIADAILGAIGAGDIGELFPDDDDRIKGISSDRIIRRVITEAAEVGFTPVNVDVVVELEKPRLTPHRREVRARIAALLGISPQAVGFKGKTGEGVGDVGGGRTIEATAVVLMVLKED